jgi:peptidoglycan biosynthesis protein MviN/MurJ (putative lipid II flippase)
LLALLMLLTPITSEWLSWAARQRVTVLFGLILSAAVIYFAVLALVGVKIKNLLKPKEAVD